MGYLEHFGFELEPFSNAPDRRFYFPNESHDEALSRLIFAVSNRRGLALCTGGIGCGKTTLARKLYDALPEDQFAKALLVVIHSDITADWLLRKFALLLGLANPAARKLELLGQIYDRLRKVDSQGRITVILIDEAQMLASRSLMEEFRGLLNLEVQERKLVNFVFFGLPEVEYNLHLDEPLRQRVAMRCRLNPMDLPTCTQYVKHRLTVAGGNSSLISEEVISRIYVFSEGVPRLVNTFCDNLLIETWKTGQSFVPVDTIEKVAKDLDLINKQLPKSVLDEVLGPTTEGVTKANMEWAVTETTDLDKIMDFMDKQ